MAFGLIAVFTIVPYLRMNGRPLMLLDVAARRFTLFGTTFLPTDTVLLALLMVSLFVVVFLATALFGRVWCGWACPQTVYLEFVFRPLERLLGGRRGPGKGGLATALRYAIYLAISVYLAHTFLAYFVGVSRLAQWVRLSPAEHPTPFLVMLATTALMMFDFAYFREQICIVACPYGRLQSVMLDRDSTIVAYDRGRGEPRARKRSGGADVSLTQLGANGSGAAGDCVDCRMCVTTCPTGIDIRDGLQMECVNCAQCIDACDTVMRKVGREPGLIRYASQRVMAGETRPRWRPRVAVYAGLLLVLGSLFILALGTRSLATVIVVRGRGSPFTAMPDGMIQNRVSVKVTNRSSRPASYTIGIEGVQGARVAHDEAIDLRPDESRVVPTTVEVPFDAFTRGRARASIRVRDATGKFRKDVPIVLIGPGTLVAHHRSDDGSGEEESHGQE